MGVLRSYARIPLITKIAGGFIAGALVGVIVGPSIQFMQPVGDLFLRLLSMMVMPLLLVTLLYGAASVSPSKIGRVGVKTMAYYLLTTAFAVVIGLVFALVVQPGTGLSLAQAEQVEEPAAISVVDTILAIVPSNPIQAMAEGDALPTVFIAIMAGLAIGQMRTGSGRRSDLADWLVEGLDALTQALFTMVRWVLAFAPFGVFALIAVTLGTHGLEALLPLAKVTLVVYGGIALQLVVYTLLLRYHGISPSRFFKLAREAMITAFVTRSSGGTLPVTMRCAENMQLNKGVYSFTLPLGATVNMDGTALYIGAATVFAANIIGVELSLATLLMVVLTASLASIGAAGMPGVGLIMLSVVLTQAGLPLAAVGLIAGIDVILDMARTMCNITGDLVVTSVISKSEGHPPNTAISQAPTDMSVA